MNLFLRRPLLLRLARLHHQLRLVCLQSLHIRVQPLLAQVLPSVVNGDADSGRISLRDASGFEFLQREAAACAHAAVVLDCGAADDRVQLVDWTGAGGGGLCGAGISAGLLLAGLEEIALAIVSRVFES